LNRAAALLLSSAISVLCAANSLFAETPVQPLTVDAIFAHEPLTGTQPSGIAWSPDGKHLTYIDDGELLEIDPNELSGAQTGGAQTDEIKGHVLVSRTKMAAIAGGGDSEKDRDHRERYKMASYQWAPDSEHLLFDSNGRLWYFDLSNGTGVQIGVSAAASGDDPKFSPNGKYVSYVHDHGLSVLLLKDTSTNVLDTMPFTAASAASSSASSFANTSTPSVAPSSPAAASGMIAAAPNADTLNGEVDWLYAEELDVRSNYFWSPDSSHLAYLQTNEASVPQYPLTDWIPTHAQVDNERYPQPGDLNPEVRVGVVGASGGRTVWIKLPIQSGQDYIPRFGWADHKTLWIETLARDQKHRDLYLANASTGQAHAVLQLTDDKFIDDDYDVAVGAGLIVLTNWNDGHNHLYLYSYESQDPLHTTAKLERQLTKGDFEVSEVYRVDAVKKLVDYASNEGNPLERHLWQVSFDGERKQLSTGPGNHDGNFAPSGGAFTDKQSSRLEPPKLLYCQSADKCSNVWQPHALEPYHLRAPEQITVKAHDGTTLYATLLLPEGATNPASVPLILNPYGGPGAQTVGNFWKDSLLFDELLAQHGFAVLRADNRGMGNRGRAFAQAAYHNFGPVQFEDQLTVLDSVLAQYPQLDAKRVGWWGWSWGGTFTLYAMTHSERFSAGVAVAPVTDWRNYDSVYTERYLSLPAEFAAGYKESSVLESAAKLKGHLLLVHGTGDDNVHLENSIQFVDKLIAAGIPYDLQLYPRKTHAIAGNEARTHLYSRILSHFEEYLKSTTSTGAAQ
jgi:dipeptidyl-peptidase 4